MSETTAHDDSTDYDLDIDNTHDKPIDVTTVSGGMVGDTVHITEMFSDGSHDTNIYTEEQGRKLFDELKQIYGDD